jgi:acetyl esterase
MPLDDASRRFLDSFGPEGPPRRERGTVAEAREDSAALAATLAPGSGPVDERIASTAAGDVPVRIHAPTAGESPFPVLVWIHGGGWVLGSAEQADETCRSLCDRSGAIVVCPEYRLAPEHRFPAAADDSYAVTEWTARNAESFGGDPARLAVGGDSAGGNLAAATALMARDRGGPAIAFQLLVYPVVGLPSDGRPSYDEFAEGHFLTRAVMEWFTDLYASAPEDTENPLFAPLRAPSLAGLPPGLVITAECDPLRDEGEAYAGQLREDGVECSVARFDGQLHGFFGLTSILPMGFEAQALAAKALVQAFAPPGR